VRQVQLLGLQVQLKLQHSLQQQAKDIFVIQQQEVLQLTYQQVRLEQ
jgi:hypothetical protein